MSLESEGKENERLREFLARTTDDGQRDTRGVLRGPRGPKKTTCKYIISEKWCNLIYVCLALVIHRMGACKKSSFALIMQSDN